MLLYSGVWDNRLTAELRIFTTTAATGTSIHSALFFALIVWGIHSGIQGSSFIYFSIFHTNTHMSQFNKLFPLPLIHEKGKLM